MAGAATDATKARSAADDRHLVVQTASRYAFDYAPTTFVCSAHFRLQFPTYNSEETYDQESIKKE